MLEKLNVMNKVNLGILGTGNIASIMAETVNKMNGIRCYAIASRSQERADVFGQAHKMKKSYGSYEELVQDKKVDLVYVATPHSEHYENVKLCIQYGKPVLCEKAFTANALQAEEILNLAKEKNVFVTEAMWIRYMPMATTIKEVLSSGVIGDIRLVTANLCYPIAEKERLKKPELAGGALLDLGVYPINFASMILGSDVTRIDSSCNMSVSGVDSQESITLHYQNGAMAVLNCSTQAVSDRLGEIAGTKGYAVIENINNFQSMTVYNDKHEKISTYKAPKQISGYEYEVEACIRALKEGWKQCPQMPHAETLRIMKWMDSLRDQWNMKYPFEA